MGKAQSKRSVDITTEPSKEIQEGSGEVKKIVDTDFKENDSSDKENKVAQDAVENEKNEKATSEDQNASTDKSMSNLEAVEALTSEIKTTEDATTDEVVVENTDSPAASTEKPKKEKVKKKWSFRSISFGKKDKQKPLKKDKKNEENQVLAQSSEVEVEKAQEAVAAESTVLETVKEIVVSETKTETVEKVEEKSIESKVAATSEPTPIAEPAPVPKPDPVAVIVEKVAEIKLAPIVETPKPVEAKPCEPEPVVEVVKEIEPIPETKTPPPTPAAEEDKTTEEPPAMPMTPPPSQFAVFAESMNTETAEMPTETVPASKDEEETPEMELEIEVEDVKEIDVEPVVEMIGQVLEDAVNHIEKEIVAEVEEEDDDLPPPPVEENGVSDETEDVKVSDPIGENETMEKSFEEKEPIVDDLIKEDKISEKNSDEPLLSEEIIAE